LISALQLLGTLKNVFLHKKELVMSATATLTLSEQTAAKVTSSGKRTISLQNFLARYTNREDPFKYEWNNGIVEKKARTMNRDQFLIFQHLLQVFLKTKAYREGALLMAEVDMYLPFANRTRRTDIAYLTSEQMKKSHDNEPTVCPFVIEVISKNDQANEVGQKLIEYFADGVEVVWVVFPKVKKVEVYRSRKEVTICFDDDICSAAPVLPDFEISVNALFT